MNWSLSGENLRRLHERADLIQRILVGVSLAWMIVVALARFEAPGQVAADLV